MFDIFKLSFLCLLLSFSSCSGVTHWILNNEINMILPLLTSPYYMKNSNDLVAFLNQSAYKKKLDDLMKELVMIKANLTSKMNSLDLFSNELTKKISCIPDYFIDESDLYNQLTKNYFHRINYNKANIETSTKTQQQLPKCNEFLPLDYNVGLFEHLDAMKKRHKLKMEPEESLGSKDLDSIIGISASNFPHTIYTQLKSNPMNWKLYTLASFYWRYKGNAKEAIECVRRAIFLAPRNKKDIPLLSLGTILQRSNYLNDSVIVIKQAIDHAPKTPENVWSLGNSLLMLSQFNKSLEAFHKVVKQDISYLPRVNFIKKSINCFRDLKTTLITMESSLDEILPGLEKYTSLKREFENYHEKLESEQVPLKVRYFEDGFDQQRANLIQRSQICSTRIKNDEPVLFCDFISDIQLVMQDFALDILNNYVELKKELITTYKINSLGIYKKISVENYSEILTDSL